MERVKKALDKFFIDGLSAMAHGLFATLIIGTIIQQIGTLIGGGAGDMIFVLGKVAASLTGAGIGTAVAYKFKEAPLVVVSAATAGMIGAFASNLLAGTVLTEGNIHPPASQADGRGWWKNPPKRLSQNRPVLRTAPSCKGRQIPDNLHSCHAILQTEENRLPSSCPGPCAYSS